MIGELQAFEPKSYDQVIGNQQVVKELKSIENSGMSLLLLGTSGIGKSCLGRLYLKTYTEYSGSVLRSEVIRGMRGNVLVNEFDALDKKKQKMFIDLIESRSIVLVATTVAGENAILKELRTRCEKFWIQYPKLEEVSEYINQLLNHFSKSITEDAIKALYNSVDNLRSLNKVIVRLLRDTKAELTKEDINAYISGVDTPMNNLEEVKSALQKSIRGSDVDAACMYANNLMDNGYLEEMCRRLRVIASEDIGLANANCVVVVTSCIENALKLGLPEAKFPVLQAVAYMALQPKSNSIHTIIDRCKQLPSFLKVPRNINNVNANTYINPHDYPNHWVDQNYAPRGFEKYKVYFAGKNKKEQAYKQYWDKVKEGR